LQESYQWNYDHGPVYQGELPKPTGQPNKSFLGRRVNSTFGVASGPLLNSRYVSLYASLGFDILTYKTVRTRKWPCYAWPNIVALDTSGQLGHNRVEDKVYVRDGLPADPREISLAVSFGMPSTAPEVWQEDISKSKAALRPGQLLVVSVVGTRDQGQGIDQLADDFALCAKLAVESGADVIETNYSCPNVPGPEGRLFCQPEEASLIARRVRERMGDVPLLVKIGTLTEPSLIRELLVKLSPFVDGITLTNGMVRRVVKSDGKTAVFPRRPSAGVVGACIRDVAQETIARFRRIALENDIFLTWLAVGGVASPEDVEDFYLIGADAVLCGTSAMFIPELAQQVSGREA
jgi:dihydroorotate dehydrogenase